MITLSHCNNLFLCLSFLLDNKLLKPRTVPWSSQLPAQCLAQSKCSTLVCGMNVSVVAAWPLCVLQMPLSYQGLRRWSEGACRGTEVLVISLENIFTWNIYSHLGETISRWSDGFSWSDLKESSSRALNAQVSEPSVTALSFFPGILVKAWKRQTRNKKIYGLVLLLA